ncbi:septation ring formation regulator EzrA [Mycoplasmoides alvi]|uniref:septation ring formation regulator EzrA n=1 Tax=Mycoplasmoides alvi TaxID=78580 RepID=UPI00051C84DE|nr:septation ring formation regulator EzrA [Mycoplasmoides alvi]
MSNIAYLIILIFFFILSISYIIYLTMYIQVRKRINKTYEYQKKYKEYAIISFSSLIKPLELLAKGELLDKEGIKLKLVIEYMNNYDERYQAQLAEIWKAIDMLSDLKYHFNFSKIDKMFLNIDEEFQKLDLWIQDFKKLTKNASGYQNETSKIMVKYRLLADELLAFLTNHILTKYDSPVFKEFISNISKNFEDANFACMTFQNTKYIKAMEKLRYSIYTLLSYVNRLYVLERKNDYLKFLIREINFMYNEAEKEGNLSNLNKLNEMYRTIIDTKEGIAKVDRDLHILQFKEAEEMINSLLKVLQPLRSTLVSEHEAKNIINIGINNFVKGMGSLEEKGSNLIVAINELNQIFADHPTVMNKINSIQKTFNLTRKSIINLQKFYFNDHKDNYSKLLEKMTNFIDLIEKLKEEIDSLISEINYEISSYKNIVHKINSLNLKYFQISKYMIDNNLLLPNPLIDEFEMYKSQIYKKTILADKDYRSISNDFENFTAHCNELFIKVLKLVVEQLSIKKMNELLMMFLNKYRHENTNIENNLLYLEKLYKDSKYEESLIHGIKLLNLIKKSAESNNLKLS